MPKNTPTPAESKDLAVISEEQLNELKDLTGESEGEIHRMQFPRVGFTPFSKDLAKSAKQEGKDEFEHAGRFQTTKKNEAGEYEVKFTEPLREIEISVILERKKLSYFNDATGSFVSSAEFDFNDEVIPLFEARKRIAQGSVEELQARYLYTDKDGKEKSNLKIEKVLYVKYNGEVYTLTFKGTNMFAYSKYKHSLPKHLSVSTVKTKITNHIEENGAQKWVLCDFENVGMLDFKEVLDDVRALRSALITEKALYGGTQRVMSVEETKKLQEEN